MPKNNCLTPTLRPGEDLHGFTILRVNEIPDIRVTAYEIKHNKTDARVLHLHCEDKENLFSVGFRTPPSDSTGVPHILEHSVLAGSEKYPVKDAFNELAKGSLKTFINAFTYPDKTVYPVASQVKDDFFNLVEVYIDLVFRPRLLLDTFLQEGHHLEFTKPGDINSELTISGIVYNEMKGVYSSADSLMAKLTLEALYPNNSYSCDSGGDPNDIPKLTYEQFKSFHRQYYSLSNAWFFLYGDITTKEHLSFLANRFEGLERIEVDSQVKHQPGWGERRHIHGWYPIGKEEALTRKTVVNIAWVAADNLEAEEVLLLQVAGIALVGSAGAPLRRALIESGLGEDLSPITDLELDLKQPAFIVGLRGTDPDKVDQIEKLVFDTLKSIIDRGIDSQLIDGALHQVEFQGREISRDGLPYAIKLMGRVYHTWLYGGDPFIGLQFPTLIEGVRQKWQKQPSLFEKIIEERLLKNKHSLISVLEPSKTYTEEKEAAFRHKMKEKKDSLSEDRLKDIANKAEILRKEQIAPDSSEALATLPRLELKDIPHEVESIPTQKNIFNNVQIMEHEIFTNGLTYLDLAFDIADLTDDLQLYLPLLGKLTLGMGAAGKAYHIMASQLVLKMGGISYDLSAGSTTDGSSVWQKMIFRMKVLNRNIPYATKLLSELLTQGDLSDKNRMRDIIAEGKNQMTSAVVPLGHVFARRTASAGLSLPFYRDEQWNGLGQLRFLAHLADKFDQKVESIQHTLRKLKNDIFRQGRLLINLTGEREGIEKLKGALEKNLLPNLLKGGEPIKPMLAELKAAFSGISIPSQVSYVAQVLPTASYLSREAPNLLVLSSELSSGYLYKRIRVQGGAYGGYSVCDSLNGNFAFLSYRDPNLFETLNVYQKAIEESSTNEISEEELRKAIISTIASLDRPLGPGEKGYVAMIRDFAGITDKHRRQFRNQVLEATPGLLKQAAVSCLLANLSSSAIAVYASDDRLRQTKEILGSKFEIQALV
ncbi:MAG: insulinase family protein [bacterium]